MIAAERAHDLRQAARDSGEASAPLRAGGLDGATPLLPQPARATAYASPTVMDMLERRAATLRSCAEMGMSRHQAAIAMGLGYNTIKRLAARLKLRMEPTNPGAPRATGPRPATQLKKGERGKGTPRLCLCGCGRVFDSLHVGERIAPQCRPSWIDR